MAATDGRLAAWDAEAAAGEALIGARETRAWGEAADAEARAAGDRHEDAPAALRGLRRAHGSARAAWQRARNRTRRAEAAAR